MYRELIKYPLISLYRSKKKFYKNNFISEIILHNRFQLLLNFARPDRLAKIRDLLQMLENNFIAAKVSRETIAIDESTLLWHDPLMFRRYNRIKNKKKKM